MDIVRSIEDFFEMIKSYIALLISYVSDSELIGLLNYLYLCIPVEVRAVVIIIVLFLLVLGLRNLFKN